MPDWIPLTLLIGSAVSLVFGWHEAPWWSALAGLVLGATLGFVFFALGGFGGGDAKLVAALGAALGLAGLLNVLFWTALAGGVLSAIAAARKKRDLAYVPAIAAGVLVYAVWPDGVARLATWLGGT